MRQFALLRARTVYAGSNFPPRGDVEGQRGQKDLLEDGRVAVGLREDERALWVEGRGGADSVEACCWKSGRLVKGK